MTGKKRIIFATVIITLFFVVLFSALFFIHGGEHDCTCGGCAVCEIVSFLGKMQKLIALACGIFIFAGLSCVPCFFCVTYGQAVKAENTPIKLKVKLLN